MSREAITEDVTVGREASAGARPPVITDPLQHAAWDSLLEAHPSSSVFHTAAWAQVLHETYGHQPAYLCRFAGERLEALLPVMEVSSPLTGRRGVSLPFTDFCAPLTSGCEEARGLYHLALEHGRRRAWRYFECRGSAQGWDAASPSLTFYGHSIDLRRSEAALFGGLESAVKRGIRKAEQQGIRIEFSGELGAAKELRGRDVPAPMGAADAMEVFYRLHCRTRRRHGLPPQPCRFFEHIARNVLGAGHGFIVIARFEERPVAAAVFFDWGRQAIYKFGASEFAFQHLRPNNLLMWESIKRCALHGLHSLHLGRTSQANEGLRRFKLGFGATEETINYYRYDFAQDAFVTDTDRAQGWANTFFRLLPPPLLRLAGQLLYPHLS
ncbi:conserved hypothetical protein [Verrucomicrobia bacterium]|nr:conserved hypothetical protein [Verrucomicrobiota bacterium]